MLLIWPNNFPSIRLRKSVLSAFKILFFFKGSFLRVACSLPLFCNARPTPKLTSAGGYRKGEMR